MRFFILIFFLFAILITGQAQTPLQRFSLVVRTNPRHSGKKLFFYHQFEECGNLATLDSIIVTASEVQFSGFICQPAAARIYFLMPIPELTLNKTENDILDTNFPDKKIEMAFDFFLTPGETIVSYDRSFTTPTIVGDLAVLDFEKLKQEKEIFTSQIPLVLDRIQACHEKNDSICQKNLFLKIDSLIEASQDVYSKYYDKNFESLLALYALEQSMIPEKDPAETFLMRFEKLPFLTKASPGAILFKRRLEGYRQSQPGNILGDFTLPDTSGSPRSLFSFRGRYALIDFWDPLSLNRYNSLDKLSQTWSKFSTKNFTIISVAVNRNLDLHKWKKEILRNKMNWHHLSESESSYLSVSPTLGIFSFPCSLLIDPEGKIICRNLSFQEMDSILSKVL